MSYLQSIENINFTVVVYLFIYLKYILEVERKQQKDETEQRFHLPSCFQPMCEFPGPLLEISRPNAHAALTVLGSLLWLVSCMIHDSLLGINNSNSVSCWESLSNVSSEWAQSLSGEIPALKEMAFWSGPASCVSQNTLLLESSPQINYKKSKTGYTGWLKYI